MYYMNQPIRAIDSDTPIEVKRAALKKYMAEEERKHKRNGANHGQKSCQRCGFCCLRQPCVPSSEEFPQIAKYLGISPQELFKQYCVVSEDVNEGFFVMWARGIQSDVVGKYLPPFRTFDVDYCVFYDKERRLCRIHEVVPQTAKVTKCWQKKQQVCRVSWSVSQIREIYPEFDPNQSSLYYFANNPIVPL